MRVAKKLFKNRYTIYLIAALSNKNGEYICAHRYIGARNYNSILYIYASKNNNQSRNIRIIFALIRRKHHTTHDGDGTLSQADRVSNNHIHIYRECMASERSRLTALIYIYFDFHCPRERQRDLLISSGI